MVILSFNHFNNYEWISASANLGNQISLKVKWQDPHSSLCVWFHMNSDL